MEDTPNIPAVIGASPEDTVTRESLYEQAWSTPMTKIAERYGVSSSYLARVFTHLNIPRPAVGYWAKVAAGKRKATPPLPEVQPGALLAWSRNGAPEQISRTPLKARQKFVRDRPIAWRCSLAGIRYWWTLKSILKKPRRLMKVICGLQNVRWQI
nr:hypothetical protein [Pseudomonas syringae]